MLPIKSCAERARAGKAASRPMKAKMHGAPTHKAARGWYHAEPMPHGNRVHEAVSTERAHEARGTMKGKR